MNPRLNRQLVVIVTLLSFLLASLGPMPCAYAGGMAPLPVVGSRISLSAAFTPAQLRGITVDPKNPLRFEFLIERGHQSLIGEAQQDEYQRLVKYFLAALTTPEDNLWVNLSPYEKNRIVDDNFGKTEMGRDLLAQDYILKQIMASLIYPEEGIGREFWDKVYARAYEQFGTTSIPVNTFNKVWIIPQEAAIYAQGNSAYIVKSHLKVMLEEDYLAKEKNQLPTRGDVQSESKMNVSPSTSTKDLASTIIREVVLPALEKEVNEGKNFAQLRQIFSAMILAQWYKRTLKDSLLGKAYVNQQKVDGVNHGDPKANQAIYQQYLQAFKKGAYNYIKEDYDQYTNQAIPRKYFSGGVDAGMTAWQDAIHFTNRAQASEVLGDLVGAGMDNTVVDLSPNKGNAAMAIDMIGLEQRDIFMSKVRELPFFSVISTDDNMGPFAFYQVMIPVDDKYGLYGLSKLANLFEQIGLMNKIKTGAALLDDDIKAMMLEMKWYFRNGRRVGLNANILGKLDKMGQGQRVDLRRWLDMNIGESVDEISPKNIVKFKSQFEHFFSNDQFSLQRAGELMMLLFKMASTPGEKQESLLKALTSLYEASEKIQQQAQEVPAQDLVNNHRHGLAVGQNTQIRVYDPRRIKSGNPYEAVMQYQQAIGELFPFIMGVILDMCDAIQPPARSETGVNGFNLESRSSGYFLGVDKQLQEASNSYLHKMVTLDQNLDWESYFRVNPSKAVSLFLTAAKLEAGVDFRLISVLKKIKIKVTVDMKKEFLLLLAHKGKIAHLLLQMHEAGLLEGFLPGLRKADERFAGGGHVFALSQHLLNLIDSLENYSLYIDWDKERPQEVDGILLPLRIAALVHDLSKEDAFMVYGYPHPLSGADVFVPETLRQLIVGIPPKKKDEIIKMVQWLVWHHQDLSARARWTDSKGKETEAQRQSLYQDLLYFVSIGLNKEKLLALYFLTLADGRSVNPDRFSIDNSSKKYINTLVKHLHGFVSLKDPAARRAVVKEWQVRAGAEREKLAEELTKGLLALDKENFKLANQPGLKVDQDRLFEYIKQENVMRHLVGQFLTGAPDFLKQNTNPRVISKYIALMAVAPFLGKGKGFAVAGDLTTSFSDMFELAVSYHGNRKGLVADITTAVASFGVSIINGQFRAIQPDPNKPDQVTFDYIAGYVKESPDWPETINYLYQNYHDVYKFLETKLKNNLTEDMFYLEAGEKSGLPIKNIRFDNLGRSIEEFAQNIGGQGINVAQHKESLTLFRNTALKVVQKTMLEEFLPWFVRQMVDGNIHWKSLVDWPIIKEYRANQQVIKTQVYFRDVKGQTRMTIKTADRPLLLASVSRILSDRFGVDIAFAPVITTHAGTRDRLLLTYQGEVLSDSMKEEIGALLKVFFSFPVLSYDALVLAAEGALVSKVGSFLKQLNADQAMSSAIAPFVAASKIFLGQMKGARSERKQELVVVLGGLVAGMEDALKDYRDMQTLPQDVGQELFNFRAALIPFLEDEYVKGPVVDLLKRVDVLSKTHTAHAVISTFEELPVVGLEEVQSVKLTEWDYLKLREFRGQLEELNASFFADDKDPGLWVNFLEGHIKELAKAPEGSFVALFSSLITTGAENKEWELRNPLAVISLAINLKINFNEYVLELKRRIANVLVVLDKLEGGVGKNYKRVKTPTSSADMLDPQVIVVDDKAMSAVDKVPGGIDLNPANMAMSVDSRGDLPAVFDLNGIDLSRIEGFSPVIISITPVTSLPVLN